MLVILVGASTVLMLLRAELRQGAGVAGETGFGEGTVGPRFRWLQRAIKETCIMLANTVEDSAKTQVWLAASKDVRERDIHGQYWVPVWSWANWYLRCEEEEPTAVAKDEVEQRKLWEFSEMAMVKAGAGEKIE